MDNTTRKQISYRNRVARGDKVRFIASSPHGCYLPGPGFNIDEPNRLVVGEEYEATVVSESNAGFRGIEMQVRIDGRLYSGISTGEITEYVR